MNVKVEWKSVSEDSGAQSAMTAGTQLMLRLSVDSLGLPLKVRVHHCLFNNDQIDEYDNKYYKV